MIALSSIALLCAGRSSPAAAVWVNGVEPCPDCERHGLPLGFPTSALQDTNPTNQGLIDARVVCVRRAIGCPVATRNPFEPREGLGSNCFPSRRQADFRLANLLCRSPEALDLPQPARHWVPSGTNLGHQISVSQQVTVSAKVRRFDLLKRSNAKPLIPNGISLGTRPGSNRTHRTELKSSSLSDLDCCSEEQFHDHARHRIGMIADCCALFFGTAAFETSHR